jgi:hypothetical protein
MRLRWLLLLVALAVPAAACGNAGKEPGTSNLAVVGVTRPFAAGEATPFVVTGTGFARVASAVATVRFTAVLGTPFQGRADADVSAVVLSDTSLGGASPLATTANGFDAYVTVILVGGAAAVSEAPIARFEPAGALTVLRDDPALGDAAD